MTKYFVAIIAVAAAGCNGDKESGDTGGTGGCIGPITLTMVDVYCDAATNVSFDAMTDNPAADGQVYAQDTANADGQNDTWAEVHGLDASPGQGCGSNLNRTIPTAPYGTTDLDLYVENVSSFFSCSQHYNQPVMSYLFFVADATGSVADCIAAGDDPAGQMAGSYGAANGVEPDFPRSACHAGTLGM